MMNLNYTFKLLTILALLSRALSVTTWKDAYNRGSPTIVSYCADPTHTKFADGLCYPPCPSTHPTDYGVATCYGICWYGFSDTGGATCTSTGMYYRGTGRTT
jgi:hypothetical protein